MNEFELLRNVTIGQYIPTGSIIHRLDPRAKIVGLFFLILATSFARTFWSIAVVFTILLSLAILSRIPIRYMMRGIILGLPVLFLVFALQFLFQGWAADGGKIYLEWSFIRVTRSSMQLIAVGVTRIVCFIFITSLLTLTTTVTYLTHGTEMLMQPFRRILRIPAHELALIVMIALRFVPTMAEEMEHVMKAQASRCGEVGQRRFWRPDKAARAYLPLIVPLFINGFRRAEDLVVAMEARCYMGGEGRTKFIELIATPLDKVVPFVALAVFALVAFVPWPPLRQLIPGI